MCQGDIEDVRRRLKEAPGDESFEFDFMEAGCTARAMAALQADPRLQVLIPPTPCTCRSH